jgi:hypothetical protein
MLSCQTNGFAIKWSFAGRDYSLMLKKDKLMGGHVFGCYLVYVMLQNNADCRGKQS